MNNKPIGHAQCKFQTVRCRDFVIPPIHIHMKNFRKWRFDMNNRRAFHIPTILSPIYTYLINSCRYFSLIVRQLLINYVHTITCICQNTLIFYRICALFNDASCINQTAKIILMFPLYFNLIWLTFATLMSCQSQINVFMNHANLTFMLARIINRWLIWVHIQTKMV